MAVFANRLVPNPFGGPEIPMQAVPTSVVFFFSRRCRHTRFSRDWSSDVCSSDLNARAAGLFPVTAPSSLPEGWHPVRSAFQRGDAGAVLRAGFRTPSGGTAQLIESNVNADALVRGELGEDVRIEDTVSLVGRDWQRYVTADGERALVLRQPDRTVIVVGQAPIEELAVLATAVS